MIALDKCEKILNKGEKKYNQDEIKQIRDYLYLMASLQMETENNNTKSQSE